MKKNKNYLNGFLYHKYNNIEYYFKLIKFSLFVIKEEISI